ncbi:MAG: HDOD domain-containing protein [Gammaproteobacteria bacterium]|nr:HDOD domain-containing protein [Gammaproteobacteria bacterium]NIR98892.1 HDOD domain-containing protein [Gammaproteobacteria bacterium]NIT64013.1 HDOD domain-containing protein [Gammaproteobacteria bacterium]NIV19173.1 HDOD domain-containing protein [Gammaproteobacteria bacterium]NIX10342.1 HDOD domain-containing protein [Gammaproteobacteria bacterium]
MHARDLVADNVELMSLPEICIRVQLMAEDPACSAKGLGRLISNDPALTARLLKLVNSAYFGRRAPVETVSRAVTIVGIRELQALTLAASAVEVFERVPIHLVDMVSFWRHSVFCALVAGRLGARCAVLHHERLFVAGLLHDVGRLLMLARLPEQAAEALTAAGEGWQQERQALGFDHAAVGAELLSLWGLPASLQAAVRWHHAPGEADEASLEAALVHLADAATHALEEVGLVREPAGYDPFGHLLEPVWAPQSDRLAAADGASWTLTGLDREDVADAVAEAAEGFEQVLAVIYPL